MDRTTHSTLSNKKNAAGGLDFEKWLNEREETLTWLEFIALIISSGKQIVRLLEKGTPIIFHCRHANLLSNLFFSVCIVGHQPS